jgi:RsiW-degrading membrane proteinase PrsW (M82 family)
MKFLQQRELDPLLLGSPLRNPRVALAISVGLLVSLAAVAVTQLAFFGSLRVDVAVVFVAALVLSTVLSVAPLTLFWYMDRRERETPWLFVAAFLWGAFMATGLALPVNSAILSSVAEWVERNPFAFEILGPEAPTLLGAPLAAPLVEEVTKGMGLLLLFFLLRAEFDNMRDGIVYGALIGLGFTWFEAPLYVAQGFAEYGIAPWGAQLGWRYALFGLGGHAMYTAILGASFGLALQTRRGWLKLLAPIVGLAAAIGAHALNNALPLLSAIESAAAGEPPPVSEGPPEIGFVAAWLQASVLELTLFLPFVLLMSLALWRSGAWERRVINEELAAEVGVAVSPTEYRQIQHDRMFRTRRVDRLNPALSAAIVNAQNELAFRKRRVRDEGRDPEHDRLVAAWREEIRLLREIEPRAARQAQPLVISPDHS